LKAKSVSNVVYGLKRKLLIRGADGTWSVSSEKTAVAPKSESVSFGASRKKVVNSKSRIAPPRRSPQTKDEVWKRTEDVALRFQKLAMALNVGSADLLTYAFDLLTSTLQAPILQNQKPQ
jgi:hypothetical protein